MIIVGLTGYSGAGKDAVADILVRDHGFTKMAFGAPLKEMIETLDPILGYHKEYCCDQCDAEVEEVRLSTLLAYGMTQDEIKRDFMYGPELRRLWEGFGTDVMRDYHEDFWVHRAADDLLNSSLHRIVFTDVRFDNEADFIRDMEQKATEENWTTGLINASSLWRIARPGVTAGEHVSEQLAGLLGEDVTILNDGSLEDLEHPVRLAMAQVIDLVMPGQMAFEIEGWEWNDNKSL